MNSARILDALVDKKDIVLPFGGGRECRKQHAETGASITSRSEHIIENAYEFALVPWRPVMDERLGRQISGVVRDSGISWDFTRARGIGIGM
jgi:hypothetical protein